MRGKPQAEVRIFHILIGDGIATNDAAAKRLWACLQERGLGPRVRYFLMVIVCGTHQVGLTAKSAVTGRAAAAAARGKLYEDIAGVAVRLFKYLVNDYYEEFAFSINQWIHRDLEILQPDDADTAGQASPRPGGSTARSGWYFWHARAPDVFVKGWAGGGCGGVLHRFATSACIQFETPPLV